MTDTNDPGQTSSYTANALTAIRDSTRLDPGGVAAEAAPAEEVARDYRDIHRQVALNDAKQPAIAAFARAFGASVFCDDGSGSQPINAHAKEQTERAHAASRELERERERARAPGLSPMITGFDGKARKIL